MENKTWNNDRCRSLSGVQCDVTACRHHTSACGCDASEIRVESRSAVKKGETFCSTFTPKAE